MSTELLPSDLCCICTTNLPKYKCPGCLRRTCSLECSKRHKAQMSCSGRRDPAAPISRANLATPAAFDRDYNYLVGVERAVEAGRRSVGETAGGSMPGGGVRPGPAGPAKRGGRGGGQGGSSGLSRKTTRLVHTARSRGVEVKTAPAGMKRSSENRSNAGKAGMTWSVEWIVRDGDAGDVEGGGHRRLLSIVHENVSVADAYQALLKAQTAKGQKRGRAESVEKKEGGGEHVGEADSAGGGSRTKKAKPDGDAQTLPSEGDSAAVVDLSTKPEADSDSDSDSPPTEQSSKVAVPSEAAPSSRLGPPYFLLHSPMGRSRPDKDGKRVPVASGLEPATALGKALKGKTILEFPTIFVFGNKRWEKIVELEDGDRRAGSPDSSSDDSDSDSGTSSGSGSDSDSGSGSDSDSGSSSVAGSDIGSDVEPDPTVEAETSAGQKAAISTPSNGKEAEASQS